MFDVLPYAYLYVCPEVNVRIVKSPGALKEVGLRILDIVKVRGISEPIGIELGSVILIVVGVERPHAIFALTKGAVMPQIDDTLGSIYTGNYTKTTALISRTGSCLIVN